jgi:hypothetical protein
LSAATFASDLSAGLIQSPSSPHRAERLSSTGFMPHPIRALRDAGYNTFRYASKQRRYIINAFTNLLGGMTQIWLNVAFIVCIFAALIFRPNSIGNASKFRRSILLFAISLVIPSISMLLPSVTADPVRSKGFNPVELCMKLANLASIIFYCAAFVTATASLSSHASED